MRKTRSQTQKSQENTIIAAFAQTRPTPTTNGSVHSKQIPTASIQVRLRSGFLWKPNWHTDSTDLIWSLALSSFKFVIHIYFSILIFLNFKFPYFSQCQTTLMSPEARMSAMTSCFGWVAFFLDWFFAAKISAKGEDFVMDVVRCINDFWIEVVADSGSFLWNAWLWF